MKNIFNSKMSANKKLLLYVLAAVIILAPTIAMLIFQPKFIRNFTRETIQQEEIVKVYFEQRQTDETSATDISIMADSGGLPVAFARVVFNFDPSAVNITGDIVTNPDLSTVVRRPQAVEVNGNGRVEIVIAAAPGDIQPAGVFELASFQMQPTIPGTDGTVFLSFDEGDMQIVESSAREMAIETSDADMQI